MAGEVTAIPWKRAKGAKNRWVVYVPPQAMPDGTRTCSDRRVVTAYSKTEALLWGQERRAVLIEEHKAVERGVAEALKPKVPTFAVFSKEWLQKLRVQAAKGEKKPSSIEAIESTIRIHVLPFIGDKRLDQIDDDVIDALEAKWVRGGYEYPGPWGKPVAVKPLASAATRNNRMFPINATLKLAVERKRIRVMPCSIKIPSVESDEAEFYDPSTYKRLVEAARELDLRIYVALLLGGDTGLRRGEIIALDKADVDFKNGEIVVRRSVYWRKKMRYETTPKGKKIKRVPCTPRLVSALRKVCEHDAGTRVLLTDDGDELTPKIIKRWIQKAERAAGLEETGRLHILRHSYCSHLAAANVPLIAIAGLARHSDLRVTQRYMHLAPGALRQGVDMLVRSRAEGGAPVAPLAASGAKRLRAPAHREHRFQRIVNTDSAAS